MSSPTIRRRKRGQTEPLPTVPPAPAAPDRGVTLNLRNPDVLRGEWDAEARKSEAVAKQDRETVARLRAEAAQAEREAGQAADEEMRLMEALNEARQRREHHAALKDARLGEAKQIEGRAQFHEDRAADLWDAMTALPPSSKTDLPQAGGSDVDSAGPTSVDLAEDRRLDEGVANLIRHHEEDPAGEAAAS